MRKQLIAIHYLSLYQRSSFLNARSFAYGLPFIGSRSLETTATLSGMRAFYALRLISSLPSSPRIATDQSVTLSKKRRELLRCLPAINRNHAAGHKI